MVSSTQIGNAVRAIANKNAEETARIIARSMAFESILNKNTNETLEHVLALSNMEENIHDKIRLFLFALDTAKESPATFMETCCTVAKIINELPDYKAEIAYNIINSAGQKEFASIIKAAGLATGKKTKRTYNKKPKTVPVHTWTDADSHMIYQYLYSPESRILHIKFNSNKDKVYSYYDVGPVLYNDFVKAESRGEFFAKWIKVQHSANYR